MKVRYTSPALADLSSILDYVAAHSPQGAIRVNRRIQRTLDLLSKHPSLGMQTIDPTIRRCTTTPYPYLIFYEPTENEVVIHAIRHAARKPHTP